jgi:hypothetical protein
MEVGRDGAGSALAGGNYQAAAGEPSVDIWIWVYFSDSSSTLYGDDPISLYACRLRKWWVRIWAARPLDAN